MKKIISLILIIIISIFIVFIVEESIRLKSYEKTPLIIMGRTKYCISCIEPGETIDYSYYSLGFTLEVTYYKSMDNKILILGKEFKLFNKYVLWGWNT